MFIAYAPLGLGSASSINLVVLALLDDFFFPPDDFKVEWLDLKNCHHVKFCLKSSDREFKSNNYHFNIFVQLDKSS
jgi:hypothetical protein